MVYIPYPRVDLNDHPDLKDWRSRAVKAKGSWTDLKAFLGEQPRFVPGLPAAHKCWYSELPLGDNYSIDVEHFRPKNSAKPLSSKHLKIIEKQLNGTPLLQEIIEGAYPWLEFDYRNYRLVTAMTNRGGAKHVYFPVVKSTKRLNDNEYPWDNQKTEYPFFLDPADTQDADLLMVEPNGQIQPRTKATPLSMADIAGLPATWRSPAFNYTRSVVTIELYHLNDNVFVKGRKEVYEKVNDWLGRLLLCLPLEQPDLKKGFIRDLTIAASPSAPFSLAARCALMAYVPPAHIDPVLQDKMREIPHQILQKIEDEIAARPCSWNNP